MKKTQKVIHSPRAFKLGLGLILAASLASMPVLTGASERAADAKAKSKTSASSSNSSSAKKKTEAAAASKQRSSSKKSSSAAKDSRKSTAEDLARARMVKLEAEAKKIAAKLTPTQKSKLLALLNDGDTKKLTGIDGIGESRSHAIQDARPLKSIEDLQKVKGVGLKTLADVVDHGKTLTRSRSSSSRSKSGSSKGKSKPASSGRSKSSTTRAATKAKAA